MRLRLAIATAILSSTCSLATAEEPQWAFENSDIPVDRVYRFGVLENGMRYVIARNNRPEGTALVRFRIGSGSLEERENELGLAHYLEHMAFNGSAKVPEGEMVKLLEREGLAFGADTNASTSFSETIYKLDLPRADPALLDIALMLMRETASELTLAKEAVDRERGIVLSEMRERNGYAWQDYLDSNEFATPGAHFTRRYPIGTLEVLQNATPEDLRGYYEREYVPANGVLVVVGDFDPALVEAKIRAGFASWQARPAPDDPDAGPVDFERQGLTDIHLDPAMSERITAFRMKPYEDLSDTAANRRQSLLSLIGYEIVNRRLAALARGQNAPFKGAGFGTSDIFEDGRTTSLIVDSADGEWRRGLLAATSVLGQALHFGFSEAEVAEQLAQIRNAQENAVSSASTRSNAALMQAALELVDEERIPSAPATSLARFEAFAPYITPAAVLAALRKDAAPLDNPMIRFRGRVEPDGGTAGLRAAWNEAIAVPVEKPTERASVPFAYTEFGPAGTVVSDRREQRFGLREIRFANGVMLTLKQTGIEQDRIRFRLSLDGGSLIDTKGDPLKTAMVSTLPVGGLGKHSQDELESVLAGRSVQLNVSAATDAFVMGGTTTQRDLELQMRVLAAALTDPGYRPEGDQRYARAIAAFFANLDGTPNQALANREPTILSDGDPRFSLQPREAYDVLNFAKLRQDIGDRLANGAVELALVGDFDEQQAIALVARTIGALPPREAEFRPRSEARERSFTGERKRHVITHKGEDNQAVVRLVWPTRDDSDLAQDAELQMLDGVMTIVVQDEIRERLAQSYSPYVTSATSSEYRGYGTFSVTAAVDRKDIEAARAAILASIETLAAAPVDPDLIERARRPLLEGLANRLKSLASWIAIADRAQSESDRLARFDALPEAIKAITGEQLAHAAKRWLVDQQPVELVVVPEGSPLGE